MPRGDSKKSGYCPRCGYHDIRKVGTATGGRSDLGGWSSATAQNDARRAWWFPGFLRILFRFLR